MEKKDLIIINKEEATLSLKNNDDVLLIPSQNTDVVFNVNEGADAHLAILFSKDENTSKIVINVAKDAKITVHCADFNDSNLKNEVTINLNETGSEAFWNLASLCKNKDNKNHSVSVFHNASRTLAKVDNYGVSKDESHLSFAGTSQIFRGSISSKTYQNAKIMVFDERSIATAKPILKIDENDVEASHAAVVGKINDEHLFYLTSRGLNENDAKALITLGYLKPILNGFNEEYQEKINQLIEGKM